MSTKQTATPRKDELSFGIELEFLFYFKVPALTGDRPARGEIPLDPAEDARLPPALTLPPDYVFYDDDYSSQTVRHWATNLVKEAILSVPGARLLGKPMPADTPKLYESMYVFTDHTDQGSGWFVERDESVKDTELELWGYRCLNFEISSPALYDRPESHRHVFRVVQALTKRFRLRVNIRSGFHCHVGAGLEDPEAPGSPAPPPPPVAWFNRGSAAPEAKAAKHSLGVFKRAAALMWAADGFLSHVHPPERNFGHYSPPIRLTSRLAHNRQVLTYRNQPGGAFSYYERTLPNTTFTPPARDQLLPDDALPSHTFPRLGRTTRFPALRKTDIDKTTHRHIMTMSDSTPVEIAPLADRPNQTVHSGVRHIMACKNRLQVAELFTPPSNVNAYPRGNFNLCNYMGDGIAFPNSSSGTVEYREAAGTLSPPWASVWSAICLGIFRFARDASEGRFWAVIEKLAQAEKEAMEGRQHEYDLVALLFDIGLFAEGLFLEKMLRAEDTKQAFWYPNRLIERPGYVEDFFPFAAQPVVDVVKRGRPRMTIS